MAKISEETRLHFAEVIKPYKEKITQNIIIKSFVLSLIILLK